MEALELSSPGVGKEVRQEAFFLFPVASTPRAKKMDQPFLQPYGGCEPSIRRLLRAGVFTRMTGSTVTRKGHVQNAERHAWRGDRVRS